jgi:hypothetical protein
MSYCNRSKRITSAGRLNHANLHFVRLAHDTVTSAVFNVGRPRRAMKAEGGR